MLILFLLVVMLIGSVIPVDPWANCIKPLKLIAISDREIELKPVYLNTYCSGHGTCVNENCECDSPYEGNYCDEIKCNGIDQNDESVCNGGGSCIIKDDSTICECEHPFYGYNCDFMDFKCNGVSFEDRHSCSGNGDCTWDFNLKLAKCECDSKYVTGNNCDIYQCNSIDSKSHLVCSSNGNCIVENGIPTCECFPGFTSENCNTEVNLLTQQSDNPSFDPIFEPKESTEVISPFEIVMILIGGLLSIGFCTIIIGVIIIIVLLYRTNKLKSKKRKRERIKEQVEPLIEKK